MTIHLRTLTAGLALAVSSASAQMSPDSAQARALAALRPNAFIRVAVADSAYSGQLVRLTATDVFISRHSGELSLPRSEIRTLWEARGRGTVGGAKRGAIIIGALGAALGALANGIMCGDSCTGNVIGGALRGMYYGAGAGLVIGGAVGTLGVGWTQRWP